ncbi:MAG: response regulator [Myxococcales bacterium]|nr:response regulator [Myxococcales bacterium]
MAGILIVDESLTVRTDLSEALEASGFRSIACATVADARVVLRAQAIELVILDATLPDGDGLELLEQIRTDPTLCALPVLVLSLQAQVKDRVRALRAGANDFVGKPYDVTQIIARIRALIGGPQVRDLVLVIDDDAAYRGQLADALAAAGFAVATAPGGAPGLQLAATARPTAITVGAVMPDVDGTSVIRRLRLDPALRITPCVVLAPAGEGRAEARDAEARALEAGADGYISKKDAAIVIARIKALLRTVTPIRVEATSVLAPKRILAVDDDPDFLGMLGDRLRKRGYDVVRATSGEEALQLLEVQTVDCILLDRAMAGLSGIETCKRLKATLSVRDTPLIMLTATESRDAQLEALGAGCDDFVSKGAGFEVLTGRVQALIRRRQVEDEQRAVRTKLLRAELEASECRTARDRAETRAVRAAELERTNQELVRTNHELEAFAYSICHDLRGPLRTIGAFTHALVEDLGDDLDPRALAHLRKVLAGSTRMGELIDALLELSRVSRAPLGRHPVNLSSLAAASLDELARRDPARPLNAVVEPNLVVEADGRLIRIAVETLLDNAWKLTRRQDPARIEIGVDHRCGEAVYFVRDNGEGFDLSHPGAAFCGTGIGLATVRRIVERHGGRVWAERAPQHGAQVLFTLPAA